MNPKDTLFSIKQTINCGGRLIDFSVPRVMGILNTTPDSFYDGGKYLNEKEIVKRVSAMLSEGADIIDVGACSTRPGAADVTPQEEMERLKRALIPIRNSFPDIILSVDTFRATVAEYAVVQFRAGLINDISSGQLDERMLPTAAALKVPFIMMHMQGIPQNMQINPEYEDITKELLAYFAQRIDLAQNTGITDLIIDPGFGFGKTLRHNYVLLHELRLFAALGHPIMVGLSRKSMIYKSLQVTPEEALNGTTVLNTLALNNGARLLRVHDVKEAVEAIRLFSLYQEATEIIG
jgi:dihydropteroate synthase